MEIIKGILGLLVLIGIAYLFSHDRKKINYHTFFWGFSLQFIFALLILGIPSLGLTGPLRFLFDGFNSAIIHVISFSQEGAKFVFGDLTDTSKNGFIFAFQVLPTIIFISALIHVLYYLKVMQKIIRLFAFIMYKTMQISGAESASMAANIFVGQIESFIVTKPYLKKMTQSEILTIMTGGMATVAGGVMAAYVALLMERIPDIGGHLLTASVMSAPAALVISKILWPETQKPETQGLIPEDFVDTSSKNIIHAASKGSSDGLKVALNVAAMLIAALAIIACADALLKAIGYGIHFNQWGETLVPQQMLTKGSPELTLSLVIGWFFSPLAFLLGIPLEEATLAGSLLGKKLVLNEFVAYLELSNIMHQLSDRTVIILSYALCGFANFTSIAIQIEGIRPLAPSRCGDFAFMGMRAVLGGTLAAFITAGIAGLLI